MIGLKYASASSSSEYLGWGNCGMSDFAVWNEANYKVLVFIFCLSLGELEMILLS